nr:MAG TPA: hypothetical protein [Caudoviricetes sp.]
MEKYLKAVSEMYSQFKKEAHPMAKYMGRLVNFHGDKLEAVGYSCNELADEPLLIVDASQIGGWSALALEPFDVVFKECKSYWYVSVSDLID